MKHKKKIKKKGSVASEALVINVTEVYKKLVHGFYSQV